MIKKLLFLLVMMVTSSWAYQESFSCFPCNENGIYYFRIQCAEGGDAQIQVDDPVNPNTITFEGPSESGIVYASEVTLESIFKKTCGE